MTALSLRGETLVPGVSTGSPFILRAPLSFWGGLDLDGRIIDRWHPQRGECLTGRILVTEAGRGSSSGSSVLAEALRLGTGPVGIVLLERDAIITVGALVATELYAVPCPVVLVSAIDWPVLLSADEIRILAGEDSATILLDGRDDGAGSVNRR